MPSPISKITFLGVLLSFTVTDSAGCWLIVVGFIQECIRTKIEEIRRMFFMCRFLRLSEDMCLKFLSEINVIKY